MSDKYVKYHHRMTEPTQSIQVLQSSGGDNVGTICICSRDQISTPTFMSALHNDWRFLDPGQGLSWLIIQGSMLVLQRNEALRQMEGDWLLFIDDDMVWQPDAIGRLVTSWKETQEQFEEPVIMGALCSRRAEPHDPTMYFRDSRHEGKYRMLEKWDKDIVEVDATGLAFLLIPKSAIEVVTGGTFPPDKETRMMYQAPPVFRWNALMGEDLRFCQDALDAGCRIMVDTRIRIGHLATKEVGYDDFLEDIARRPKDIEDMVRKINDKHDLPTMTAEEAQERLGWSTRPAPSEKTK
jgi:hypothetical protein